MTSYSKTPVRMSCGHYQFFRSRDPQPSPGDYMYCMQCRKQTHCPYPMPLDVDGKPRKGEWRWLCTTKTCHGGPSKNHGQNAAGALHAASRHIRSHPYHFIHVIKPDGVISDRFGRDPCDAGLFPLPEKDQASEPLPF